LSNFLQPGLESTVKAAGDGLAERSMVLGTEPSFAGPNLPGARQRWGCSHRGEPDTLQDVAPPR